MSPALEAAMATIVPTVRTAACRVRRRSSPRQRRRRPPPSSVTSVIPEAGCDDTPTMPTIRAATATNRMPNTPTPAAHTARCRGTHFAAEDPGHQAGHGHDQDDPAMTTLPGRSRSVALPAPRLRSRTPPFRQAANDGEESPGHRRRACRATAEMIPAVATAPRSALARPAASAPSPRRAWLVSG